MCPSTNLEALFKLPVIQFLLTTAFLSLGSTVNMHICSMKPNPQMRVCSSRNTNTHAHTSHSSLFLFLFHADSTSSASLSICHSLTAKTLLPLLTLLSFNASRLAEQVTHVVIWDVDVLIVNLKCWIRTIIKCEDSVGCCCCCRQYIQLCLFCYNISATLQPSTTPGFVFFTEAKPRGLLHVLEQLRKETNLAFLFLFMLSLNSTPTTVFLYILKLLSFLHAFLLKVWQHTSLHLTL